MVAQKRLLLIEDDIDLREAIARQLALNNEFVVEQAGTAEQGIALVKASAPDFVVLDVELPDLDGREVCRTLRRSGFAAPIVMLTGQTADSDIVLGLEAGANDYVTKPVKFIVLLARVRAHLRTHEQSDEVSFRLGPYEFQPASRLLIDPKQGKIRLTDKETDLLKHLYRANGKTVSREELLVKVWGYNSQVSSHTLETHMYRLRQKLEPVPSVSRYLMTDSGGYRLQIN